MNPAALFLAVGGAVVTVGVGAYIFADDLGLRPKAEQPAAPVAALTTPIAPSETETPAVPSESEKAAPAAKAEEKELPGEKSKTEPTPKEAQDVAKEQPKPATEAAEQEKPEGDVEEMAAPSFDVVRVEPDGQTLVAGQATPGSKVELNNGETVIAEAMADENGDWVMILEEALKAGVSDLSLSASSQDGSKVIQSESNVTVALPEDGQGELLVMETKPGEASKIIAKVANPEASPPTPLEGVAKTADVAEPKADDAKEMVVAQVDSAKDAEAVEQKTADVPTAESPVAVVEDKNDRPLDAVPEAKPAKEASVVADADKPVEEKEEEPRQPVTAEAEVSAPEEPSATAEITKPQSKPVSSGVVAIEAVEIENDVLFVAGAAEPKGSKLRLYVDNKAVGSTRSGETGRFLFDGKLKLQPGQHSARVDLLDGKTGQVAKRAEVIFTKKADVVAEAPVIEAPKAEVDTTLNESQPEAKPEPAPTLTVASRAKGGAKAGESVKAKARSVKTRKVIIRRGDNLWEIARRVYGKGVRFSTIYDINSDQIRDPHWIYPGQVFTLPHGEAEWEHNFDAVDEPPEAGLAVESPAPVQNEAASGAAGS